MKTLLLVLLASFLPVFSMYAQTSADSAATDSTSTSYHPKDDFSITAFPILYYLPETSFAFGCAGITVFNIGQEKTWRQSQVRVGVAYTLKKQFFVYFPYELYLGQKWKVHGELGYYHYFYNYFGIGRNSIEDSLEVYNANYPRFLGTASYRIKPKFLMGLQYHFEHYDIPSTGVHLTEDHPTGSGGGTISSLGLVATYDSRDDIFYPKDGFFATLLFENADRYTFSDFNYSLVQLDFSYYKSFNKKHILAFNYFAGTTLGNAPFFTYYYFSSAKKGRGYNDHRFIDRDMDVLQAEYRFPIYKRFKGTVFGSVGSVGDSFGDEFKNKQLFSYGTGFRFQLNKKQSTHMRLDIAHSKEGFQFYFTLGEAF